MQEEKRKLDELLAEQLRLQMEVSIKEQWMANYISC
jgi:hypothetical protein